MIVGCVLVPAGVIVGLAAVQGIKLLDEFNESNIRLGLSRLRSNNFVNLESPAAVQFRSIDAKLAEIKKVVSQQEFEGVRVFGNTIDFGPRGVFEREGQNTLSPAQRTIILQFTPKLLAALRDSEAGKVWFKRAVIEGYASQSGKYLFNLNLSLERSQRVICELLRTSDRVDSPLSEEDRKLIATKFFVGGASFNSLRATAEDSRRIEFKLEFKTRQERDDELINPPPVIDEFALAKALDPAERCPIFSR